MALRWFPWAFPTLCSCFGFFFFFTSFLTFATISYRMISSPLYTSYSLFSTSASSLLWGGREDNNIPVSYYFSHMSLPKIWRPVMAVRLQGAQSWTMRATDQNGR